MNKATDGKSQVLSFIDGAKMSLDEWLSEILKLGQSGSNISPSYCFPTVGHKNQYLATIGKRHEYEIYRLLERFLISSCSLGNDHFSLHYLRSVKQEAPSQFQKLIKFTYYRRLIKWALKVKDAPPPIEGITWVLDLLPYSPKDALDGLTAYVYANCQFLPDDRLQGLFDADSIIRARFIGMPDTIGERVIFLSSIHWRDFECIVERLYDAMGYETQLTPPQKDGGRDIIAIKKAAGNREHILIECKKYSGARHIGVDVVRQLLGVVSDDKCNKGVIVTSSVFTQSAIDLAQRNPRIELIDAKELVPMLNKFLGTDWTLRFGRLVYDSKSKSNKPSLSNHTPDADYAGRWPLDTTL